MNSVRCFQLLRDQRQFILRQVRNSKSIHENYSLYTDIGIDIISMFK